MRLLLVSYNIHQLQTFTNHYQLHTCSRNYSRPLTTVNRNIGWVKYEFQLRAFNALLDYLKNKEITQNTFKYVQEEERNTRGDLVQTWFLTQNAQKVHWNFILKLTGSGTGPLLSQLRIPGDNETMIRVLVGEQSL